ncbi:hypothetical protein ZEAMMB73_Zm00001d035276, partial [Zea mays]
MASSILNQNRTMAGLRPFPPCYGIVLHLEPLKHIGGRPYREAVLMDSRWDLIIVGVWTNLLQRNALRWSLARVDKKIIIGTMLRRNNNHGCLETSDHNTSHFNPDHHTTYFLKNECPEVPVSDESIIDLTISYDNTQGGRTDASQCKIERERARYAAMSAEKRNELKKHRESCKKENAVHHEYSKDDCPDVSIGDGSIIDCTILCGTTL